MYKIAVIGTAGRGNTASLMSESLFWSIVAKAEDIVTSEWKLDWSQIHLVSGGAAWADHAAIRLFLAHPSAKLTLHFPCRFIAGPTPQFEDLGSSDWRKNPGRTANQYHKQFSTVMTCNSMLEISEAIKAGAIVATETGGFHARNTKIALAQRMIAFTWSDGNSPEKGGTLDTWKKCKGLRVHVGLKSIVRTEMVEAAGKGQPEVVCKRKRDEEKEEKTTQKRSCL